MASQHSTTLLILAQALKGLEDSKVHLKKAATEFLLAAQSIASTANTIAVESNLIDAQSPFRDAFKKGENILNLVIRSMKDDESDAPSEEDAEEQKKIARLPTQRKNRKSKPRG